MALLTEKGFCCQNAKRLDRHIFGGLISHIKEITTFIVVFLELIFSQLFFLNAPGQT